MFYDIKAEAVVLRVRLTPNAAAQKICGCFDDADGEEYLKISVTAVPEKGKANKDLIALLSKKLKLPKGAFKIVSGETDRYKKLEISGNVDMIVQTLENLTE